MFWTHKRSALAVVAALLTLALAGCGGAGATSIGTGGTQATATPAPTATATPLPTVEAASLPTDCNFMSGGTNYRVGDLAVSKVTMALQYPAWAIPQGTPNQPLHLASTGFNQSPTSGSVAVGSHGATDGYFAFSVCNLSTSQSYTLQSASVRVASFTPNAGGVTVWNPCQDGTYDALTQSAFNGGCGGGFGANEYLQATFPANAGVGDSVIAQVASTSPAGPNDPNPYPKLPLALAPGHVVGMGATLTVPTAPGTYAFAFGLSVGSEPPVYFSTSTSTLYAPITKDWTGHNCTTPAMQAQIPTATQDTYYICPPAA